MLPCDIPLPMMLHNSRCFFTFWFRAPCCAVIITVSVFAAPNGLVALWPWRSCWVQLLQPGWFQRLIIYPPVWSAATKHSRLSAIRQVLVQSIHLSNSSVRPSVRLSVLSIIHVCLYLCEILLEHLQMFSTKYRCPVTCSRHTQNGITHSPD